MASKVTRRMHPFTQSLFRMNYLAGSVPISETRPEQLKSVYMRIPCITGGVFDAYFTGARKFWHKELTRLKFKNPALDVNVDIVKRLDATEPYYMTLGFESSSRAALDQLTGNPLPKPFARIHAHEESKLLSGPTQSPVKAYKGPAREETYQINIDAVEWKSADLQKLATRCEEEMGGRLPLKINPFSHKDMTPPVRFTETTGKNIPDDKIVAKAQPAADASQPQTTSPPETIYSRKITTPITGLRHVELWSWMKKVATLPDRVTPPKEAMDAHLEWKADHKKRNIDARRTAIQNGYRKRVARRSASAKAEAQRVASDA